MSARILVCLVTCIVTLDISWNAFASLELLKSKKNIVCDSHDGQKWVIDKERGSIQFTVFGESSGPQQITQRNSDGQNYVSFTTNEGTLTLSNRKNTFVFDGEEDLQRIKCK